MYMPEAHRVDDRSQLHEFIEAHSFGILVSAADDCSLAATHLPLLLHRDAGPHGTLLGHVARANPQWRSANGREVLVIFPGPHAYVSPAWYHSEAVVPTWNYVTVHAYGVLQIIDDEAAVLQTLAELVERHEHSRPDPWRFDASTEFARRMAGMVAAFRIEITRLEGKWKLSQNHSVERRKGVVAGLLESGGSGAAQIAMLMEAHAF